jgi:hypothetical protein
LIAIDDALDGAFWAAATPLDRWTVDWSGPPPTERTTDVTSAATILVFTPGSRDGCGDIGTSSSAAPNRTGAYAVRNRSVVGIG